MGEGVRLGPLLHPSARLRRDGEVGVGPGAQEPADQRLAAPVAVDIGGVEEGDPGVDGGGEDAQGGLLADGAPVGSELPGAEANHADGTVQPGKGALLHEVSLMIQACPDSRWALI